MGVAVVAIPAKDDRVWGLSSEKVPHLTLLYLGEGLSNSSDFIERLKATSLSFHEFYLPVERRGRLGDENADVLFFDKNAWQSEYVEKIRAYLRLDPAINKAYNSVKQFATWTPHLTLGYPESPPKKDAANPDDPVTLTVTFDRIAVWTGDYEGVEFPLKTTDNVLSMSARTKGEEFIQHFGVKGMKWGVIRDKVRSNAAIKFASASEDHKRASKVKTKAKVVGVHALSNKDLQDLIGRMNLEVQYKNLKTVEHEQSLLGKGKLWAGRFVTKVAGDILVNVATSWLKRPGSGRSATARGRAWVGNQPTIEGVTVPSAINR